MRQVRLFGPTAAVIDGRPVDLGAAKQRAVLAVLALDAGHVVSLDRLTDAIWGEDPPPSARNAIQVYVTGLRRALGADVIRTAAPGYRLELDPDDVDVLRFERLLATDVAAALALWDGPPLADLAGMPFAATVCTRLTDLRLRALEDRIDADLEGGKHAALTSELETQLAETPYRERLWRQLMLAHYRSGRQADALDAFQRARAVLADDLGIEPGPALAALQQAILVQDPVLDLAPPETAERFGGVPPAPTVMIGRDTQLRAASASVTQHRLTTLVGPGGIGKTRLAIEIAHDVDEAFPAGVVFADLSTARDANAARTVIAHALRAESGADDRQAIASGLGGRRCLLVLDNTEQISGAADLVGQLLEDSDEAHVLVTTRVVLRLAAEHVVRVPPLAHADARALLTERIDAASGETPTPDVVAELAGRLDGLPLAIVLAGASCRSASAATVLDLLDKRLELPAEQADAPQRQRTLQAAVEWSLDLIGADELALLTSLTVFQAPFTWVSVRELHADTPPTAAQLARLAEASLVLDEGGTYRMVPPIREHLVSRISADAADALADRHADWIARVCADAPRELYEGDEAAARARLIALVPEMRAGFERLLVRGRAEEASRCILDVAQIWFRAGRVREALANLDRVVDLPGLTARSHAEALAMRGCFAKMLGDEPAMEWLTSGAAALREHAPDSVHLVNTVCHLADLHLQLGDNEAAVRYADEAVTVASARSGDEGTLSMAWDLAGYIARGVHDRERAIRAARAAVAEARRHESAMLAEAIAGLAASLGADDPTAAALAWEAIALTEKQNQPTQRAKVINDVAPVLAAIDPGDTAQLLAESIAFYLATSMTPDCFFAIELLAEIAADIDPAAAVQFLAAVERRHETVDPSRADLGDRLRSALGPGSFARTWGRGAALDDDALSRLVADAAAKVVVARAEPSFDPVGQPDVSSPADGSPLSEMSEKF